MTLRIRPTAVTSIALLAGLTLPAASFAANAHAVRLTLKETAISYTPGSNGPPTFAVEAGVVTGSLGSGVDRTAVHVRAGKGTRVLYTDHGTVRGHFVFSGKSKAGGDTIVGTFTVTGGTGTYSGAHGVLSISGFHSNTTNISTEHLSGTLTY